MFSNAVLIELEDLSSSRTVYWNNFAENLQGFLLSERSDSAKTRDKEHVSWKFDHVKIIVT